MQKLLIVVKIITEGAARVLNMNFLWLWRVRYLIWDEAWGERTFL